MANPLKSIISWCFDSPAIECWVSRPGLQDIGWAPGFPGRRLGVLVSERSSSALSKPVPCSGLPSRVSSQPPPAFDQVFAGVSLALWGQPGTSAVPCKLCKQNAHEESNLNPTVDTVPPPPGPIVHPGAELYARCLAAICQCHRTGFYNNCCALWWFFENVTSPSPPTELRGRYKCRIQTKATQGGGPPQEEGFLKKTKLGR